MTPAPAGTSDVTVERIDEHRWRIPKSGAMRVDGLVYASEEMMLSLRGDPALTQVRNVAHLPGIVHRSLAMPDIHWGYGFPIGGVAAFSLEDGVVSPGGVGYDINCGVRLLRSSLPAERVRPVIRRLVDTLFSNIPTGVGSHRKDLRLKPRELADVAARGAAWALGRGFATERDLAHIEAGGCLPGADPALLSDRAVERGLNQLGTTGSGNHFVEVGFVEEIFDESAARALGLAKDGVTVTIHTGSRGFGYQVCEDSLKTMLEASRKYGIALPDRQLCCAPLGSPEGKRYLAQMACAANFAFTNRQVIAHWVRESFAEALSTPLENLELDLVYDVCHNIAKMETVRIGSKEMRVCVHRKGATRAYPPGHPEIPAGYRDVGQPVLIPGDMGRYSYVLVGTERAMAETFGSTCHGAGRRLSRGAAIRTARGRSIRDEMEERGVVVRVAARETMAEEMPEAYKDVADVVDVVHGAGIARKVARLKPIGVIKG